MWVGDGGRKKGESRDRDRETKWGWAWDDGQARDWWFVERCRSKDQWDYVPTTYEQALLCWNLHKDSRSCHCISDFRSSSLAVKRSGWLHQLSRRSHMSVYSPPRASVGFSVDDDNLLSHWQVSVNIPRFSLNLYLASPCGQQQHHWVKAVKHKDSFRTSTTSTR